ncbi:hypothetical protein [Haploplasma axanthum]|uniref:Uncharacterized protein n=1 Tax=Haploplasma axanthum TaxID=29552 RepID=A0A449BBL9_HAPAX|nr:hypothetical protein [Haploplasma axanthum]VEU79822.1 Uncharacterised protein [Haploplasma axanthum]
MIKNKKNKTYKFYVFSAPLLIWGIDEKIWKIALIVLALVILLVCLIKIAIRARKNKEKNNQEIEIIVEKTKPIIIQKKEEMKPMKKEERKTKNNNLDNNGLYIRYNYSFVARMHQAPKESQERFSEIKNYLLTYEDVTIRKSWRNERFMYHGRPVVKF